MILWLNGGFELGPPCSKFTLSAIHYPTLAFICLGETDTEV